MAQRDPHREATGFASRRRVGRRNRCGVTQGEEKQRRRWAKPTGAPRPATRSHPQTAAGRAERSGGGKTNRKASPPKKAAAA